MVVLRSRCRARCEFLFHNSTLLSTRKIYDYSERGEESSLRSARNSYLCVDWIDTYARVCVWSYVLQCTHTISAGAGMFTCSSSMRALIVLCNDFFFSPRLHGRQYRLKLLPRCIQWATAAASSINIIIIHDTMHMPGFFRFRKSWVLRVLNWVSKYLSRFFVNAVYYIRVCRTL